MIVEVQSGTGAYPVVVQNGAISALGTRIEACVAPTSLFVLTDERVDATHGTRLREVLSPADVIRLPVGERHKTLDTAARILDGLADAGVDRGGALVSFGGGVVSDLGGFAAAVHLRGIAHVIVPTTLLAQVDAAIGGKTGVDTPRGKNLVGAFWAPRLVVSDPELLATLDRDEWINGLAEVVKTALIGDVALFEKLESRDGPGHPATADDALELVTRTARVKVGLCSDDELDRGTRQALNLGHTIGHALEAATGFTRFRHGEAVAIGLAAEAALAERIGLSEVGLAARIAACLTRLGLPIAAPGVDASHVRSFLTADKKRVGAQLRFALPRAVGDVELVDLDDPVLIDAVLSDATSAPTS